MRRGPGVIFGIAAALLISGVAQARPITSGSCTAWPGQTTVNYLSKTSQVVIRWYTDGTRQTQIGENTEPIDTRKPGSISVATPVGAGLAEVLITSGNPNSQSFRTLCT